VIVRAAVLAMLGFAAIVAGACGSGSGQGQEPSPSGIGPGMIGASREGSLIMTRPDGLYEMAVKGGEVTPLITTTDGTYLLDPALSPDATQLAYVAQPPPRIIDGRYDAGSDIWIADRDGGNPRMLYQHNAPNQLVRFPRWLDESTVFAIIQPIETVDGVTQAVYTLQRIDVATGEHTVVLEDVLAFDISPDGSRIVYARLSPATGEVLNAVDIDGIGNPVELVPVTENLAPFNSPEYSPTGEKIAFTAADQNMALPTGQRLVTTRPVALTLDGLPQDAWVIAAKGGPAQLAADLKEDIPGLTWGGDDQYIYVLGARALYEINLENGAVAEIGEGVFHGQLTWAPGG
jgi:dipeptidyl aminopeptidase/acylaminoacyl peptidase